MTEPSSGGGETPGSQVPAPQPQAVRTALSTLPVPQPSERFWNELEVILQEEAPLQIMPRPAIRPITQPPSQSGGDVVPDVFEQGGHRSMFRRLRVFRRRRSGAAGGQPGRRGPDSARGPGRRRLLFVAIVALVLLVAVGLLYDDSSQDSDNPPDLEATGQNDTTETSAPETEGEDEEPPEEEPPVAQGVEPDQTLWAGGLGVLRTGEPTLREVADLTGVEPEVNQQAFDFSGGTCFEAYLPGAEDVTLWIRSPEPAPGAPPGVEDPDDGVLVAMSVPSSGSSGSMRQTDAGAFWGMPEEDLVAVYEGTLRQLPNPHRSDGSIYVTEPPPESENAIAYFTGFGRVTEIRVGHIDLVSAPNICY